MTVDDKPNPQDVRRWEAIEEAAELLQEAYYDQALTELKRVLLADANNAYAYYYTGIAFFELKKLDAARDAFQAAIRASDNYLGARVSLSNTYRLLKQPKEAMLEAVEALKRFPEDGEAMHALGLAEAMLGNRSEARQHLNGYLESNPEFEAAQEVRQVLEMLGLGEDDEPVEFE